MAQSLSKVALGAQIQRRIEDAFVAVHGQEDDARGQIGFLQLARHVKACLSGHVDIQNGDVRLQRVDAFERLRAVGGFGRDLHARVGGDAQTQAAPEDRMIVGNDDGDFSGHAALFLVRL